MPLTSPDGKKASSRQDVAGMHSKAANFGKICIPCILQAMKNAVWEYIPRVCCHQDTFLPSKPLRSCMAIKSCHSRRGQLLLGDSCRVRWLPLRKSCHLPPREGGSCWAILTTLDGYRRANPGAGGFRRTNPNTFKDFHWTNPAARQLPSRESRHAQLLQCGAGCNSLCAKT